MGKKVLEIHEVDERLFSLPLKDLILTFDDGLYTQYKYINKLEKIDTRKIFFISTDIVCNGKQSEDSIPCDAAHEYFFRTNDARHYMTWDQIREISKLPNCEIGGHGHFHKDLETIARKKRLEFIREDTKLMEEAFISELGYCPSSFCFPYNYTEVLYNCILHKTGFTEFFGEERLSINRLFKPS